MQAVRQSFLYVKQPCTLWQVGVKFDTLFGSIEEAKTCEQAKPWRKKTRWRRKKTHPLMYQGIGTFLHVSQQAYVILQTLQDEYVLFSLRVLFHRHFKTDLFSTFHVCHSMDFSSPFRELSLCASFHGFLESFLHMSMIGCINWIYM